MILALEVHKKGFLMLDNQRITPKLPEECIGVCMVFKTKKAARKFAKEGVQLVKLKEE